MDLFANVALGFSVALTPTNLLFCFLGSLVGTLVGVLPGLGPVGAVAFLLSLTFKMEPATRDHHARRHLLRRHVRRLDDLDSSQYPRRNGVGSHLSRRLPNGAPRPRGRGFGHLRFQLVYRRNVRRDRAHVSRAACLAERRSGSDRRNISR